jgi:hypothetical protein
LANKQVIRQFIGKATADIIKSKEKRLNMSIVRTIQEDIYNRTYNNKDIKDANFRAYTPEYKVQKAKILSGKMKGRGGKGTSKTLALYNRRKALLKGGNSSARSVDDKMRLSGLMLNRLKVVSKISIARGSNRVITNLDIDVEGNEIKEQVKGLAKNGYKWLGYENRVLPTRVIRKLQANFNRILND